MFRIGERHLSAEVGVASKQVGKCIATIVAGQHDVDYGFCQWNNIVNDTWTTLIQYQNDWLSGCSKSFYQITLVFRHGQVGQITRSFAVRVFSDAGNNHIGTTGCGN